MLVVLEPALNRASYSQFWQSLEGMLKKPTRILLLGLIPLFAVSARGFKLTFKGPKEEQSPLIEYDEKIFDHLIMMAPSTTCKKFLDKHMAHA